MKKKYDRTLKQVIPKELKPYYDPQAQVKIDYPVSQEGFTIDLVFERISSQEIKQVDFPPYLLTPHLCFQLRHAGSTLSALDLDQFLGQIPIYKSQEKLTRYRDVSLVVVVSNISQELLENLEDYAFKMVRDGVYLDATRFRTVVIVSNQLAVIPENYPYLLISEGDKRREFIERILVESNGYYVTHAYKLYPEEVRTMAEEKGIELEEVLTPQDLIQDLGVRKIVKTILEEDMLTPKDLIQDLGIRKIIETSLKEGLLTPEDLIEDLGVERLLRAVVKKVGKGKIKEYLKDNELS